MGVHGTPGKLLNTHPLPVNAIGGASVMTPLPQSCLLRDMDRLQMPAYNRHTHHHLVRWYGMTTPYVTTRIFSQRVFGENHLVVEHLVLEIVRKRFELGRALEVV